mmetsp:Transcript_19652/g.34830  ORF Transcript_19652/g.34830 Transcript_19652/m.34830 type:complete len:102 (-) Transcript_19652:384-689(-)
MSQKPAGTTHRHTPSLRKEVSASPAYACELCHSEAAPFNVSPCTAAFGLELSEMPLAAANAQANVSSSTLPSLLLPGLAADSLSHELREPAVVEPFEDVVF